MGKKLVVVESPAKAKTIGKILGKGYIVKSSMGHIRDLPVNRLGVDIEKGFKPRYSVVKGKRKVVSELKKAAESADAVYLAPDPDREGEAIAWHLVQVMKDKDGARHFRRVCYNEITPAAVRRAFENPGEIDLARVDAQQARRILDRIVGYKVSPLLWRRIKRGLSAGRVQSVALRLVCEREKEIRGFKPEEYWIMGAMVRKMVIPLDPFRIKLVRVDGEKIEVHSADRVEAVKADLDGRSLSVKEIKTKEVRKKAPPPHITSTLQQAGSTHCGYSPHRTMSIAQKLYEGVDLGQGPAGLITYMRTDSFNVAKEALDACRDLITRKFGKEYCPEKPHFFKSRASAQEAHEAIRPTDVTRTPESVADKLNPQELKLYRLIWQRFVASQMEPARIRQRTAVIVAPPPEGRETVYEFQASASEIAFPGYMKANHARLDKAKEDSDEVEKLPDLVEGEPLICLEWLADRKETSPPPRFSEASLVRALENNGVGRPSTYAQIVGTLNQRHYVSREKRTLAPTDLGMQVNDLLVENLGELFDVGFTASMEESLDEVEKGAVEWTGMLGSFYERFEKWMDAVKEPSADRAVVLRFLDVLAQVTEWAPEIKTGKRTYSDERFVASIRSQVVEQGKDVSQRQLDALVDIAVRYRDQSPEIGKTIEETGFAEKLSDEKLKAPRDTTVQKLTLLESVPLEGRAKDFVDSLRARVTGRRSLTDAQIRALNNVVLRHAGEIEGFEAMKDSLDLDDHAEADTESGPLLEAMAAVSTWKEPVTKGKRVFDDRAFHESLKSQFDEKGFLSVRQRSALKRMVRRYRDQVPGYADLAEKLGLERSGKKKQGKRS